MDASTAPANSRGAYARRYQSVTSDLTPRKTAIVMVIVIACFAVLWPKVFYPMLVGNANQQMKPNAMDKAAGCCDVFSENDMNTIKLMSELCSSIIEQSGERLPKGKEIVSRCRKEVLETCGIDISAVLQEQIRLGGTVKQILNEVRSLNGSLCLKYHFGVSPWRLGVGHRIRVNYTITDMKQERPPNMRPDSIHPAFRERGSAIPKPPGAEQARKSVRTIEGRPLPGLRPTIGGPGHVVQAPQKSGSSMGVLMPIYTIGIVIFFTYTLMKIIFKRDNTGVRGNLYPPIDPDPRFRREVFESERCRYKPRLSRDPSGRIVVNAMSALLDEVNEEIEQRRKANEIKNQAKLNGNLSNGTVAQEDQTSVKVLGMETTASCEGGEKWNKPGEPIVPHAVPKIQVAPPQEIYLEGALPAQSQILVTDSATVTQANASDTTSNPAVVLAGKMTLSVISLDSAQEEGVESEKEETIAILDINGDDNIDDDALEESKYTTASSATAAEREISDAEGTDDENCDEEVEKINELDLDVNQPERNDDEIGRDANHAGAEAVTEDSFVVIREGENGSEKNETGGMEEIEDASEEVEEIADAGEDVEEIEDEEEVEEIEDVEELEDVEEIEDEEDIEDEEEIEDGEEIEDEEEEIEEVEEEIEDVEEEKIVEQNVVLVQDEENIEMGEESAKKGGVETLRRKEESKGNLVAKDDLVVTLEEDVDGMT